MKTKLVFTALLIIAVIFGFKNSSEESKNKSDLPPKDNEFLITAMHVGEVDPNYIYFPDLGANAWHKYTGPDWGWPGISNDNYSTPTADYRDAVLQRIDNNRNHGFRSIMDRPKIEYLSFGQKSEYQCEDVSRVDPDLWFYTYKTHTAGQDFLDTSQFGNNQWVKYCQVNPDSPGVNQGYVVKDLKANREQANRNWPAWIADSAYKWYVMPKIRIPIGISGSTPVCKIEVLDWDGDLIKVEELTAEKFRSNQILYNGRYMEEFYFDPDEDSSAIEIPSGAMCPGPRRDFSDWVSVPVNTDFRVYWYGECDMWIDYVKVENLPAHQLFKGQWDQQIKEETDIALEIYDPSNPIPNNFYIEEFEFNIVSAMSYVDSIIQNRSQNKISLMVNLNYPLFSVHIPLDNNNHRDELSASYINKHLIEKAKLKYIVNMSYPLEGFVGNLYPVNNSRLQLIQIH